MFNEKKGKFGIRRLKMTLRRRHRLDMNLKKIIRIKRHYGLVTAIRKRSRTRLLFKQGEEHQAAANLLKRNFTPRKDQILFSTDITELQYLGGKKAFLSATKDLGSKKIVHFNVAEKPTLEVALGGLDQFFKRIPRKVRKKVIMHSDQGGHYTSYAFRMKLAEFEISQSMSRKGNCLDNAPIESFFGHLKDEADYKTCKNFKDLRKKITEYMEYYNHDRPQWDLKQKTPAEAGVKFSLV